MNKTNEEIVSKVAEWIFIAENMEDFYKKIAEWYAKINDKIESPDIIKKGKERWAELLKYRDAEHNGDCVYIPSPCSRCQYEELMDMARTELSIKQ